MYYGEIKKQDIADGPGVRVTLFVSGCRHHCPGCFNAQTWDFSFGREFTEETKEEVLEALSPTFIAGLTLLGGEPFEPENQSVLLPLLREVRERYPKKTICDYSGYTWEQLHGDCICNCEHTEEMLSLIDMLVDGEFHEEEKNLALKFRGSSNQRILEVQASITAGHPVCSADYPDRSF